MAFVLPTFPSVCDIYTWPYNYAAPPRLANVPCQLRAPNAALPQYTNGLFAVTNAIMLLLPPKTDIRDTYATPINAADSVVLPVGTTCRYLVLYVNDIARDFPNEHRYAIITKTSSGPWPVPMP